MRERKTGETKGTETETKNKGNISIKKEQKRGNR
jgi:hypothetical protein